MTQPRLNEDILLAVFALLKPRGVYEEGNRHRVVGERPDLLSLLLVCREWNAIAESNSDLWSSLEVYHPSKAIVPAVKRWLERAQDRPLRLALVDYKRRPDVERGGCEVLAQFVERYQRWKSISVAVAGFIPETLRVDRKLIGTNEHLENAEFRHGTEVPTILSFELWQALLDSPALRSLTWVGRSEVPGREGVYAYDLPMFTRWDRHSGWAKIRFLKAQLPRDPVQLWECLCNLEHLVVVAAEGEGSPLDILEQGREVTRNNLRKVEFLADPQRFEFVIPIAPNLSTLIINCRYVNLRSVAPVMETWGVRLRYFECGILNEKGGVGGMWAVFARTLRKVSRMRLVFKHQIRRTPWRLAKARMQSLKRLEIQCEQEGCQEHDYFYECLGFSVGKS